MGNRCFLYILRPGGAKGEFEEIAEANNTLPSMWQVLLGQSAPAASMDCQRAFGEAGTINICTDAAQALERYRALKAFIQRAPRSFHIPGLLRYLGAAEQFLAQQVARWTMPGLPAPVFCANFDELSWMDDSRPHVFTAHRIEEFTESWEVLQHTMREDKFHELQDVLCFADWGMHYDEWIAWSAVFGFCSLGHLYFSGSYKQPRDTDFADFDPDDDASNGENYLGGGCSRFKQDGKWGVHRWDEHLAPTTVLAPEWDRVLHAGQDEQELVWIQRADRIGLAAISGEDSGRVLLQPCLDAVWDFVDGLAIARQGAQMGYLQRDGGWFIAPAWDEAWRYANGYAVVAKAGKHGYLDPRGNLAIEPQFDEADEFGTHAIARVRLGATYGLIRDDGSFVVEPVYSRLEWFEACGGWLIEQNGRQGLLRIDGAPWLSPQWEALECLARNQLLLVRDQNRCGAIHWDGEQALPCEYQDLQARYPNGVRTSNAVTFADNYWQSGAPVELIARRDGRAGLIDATGRVLLPFSFSGVETFEPHPYPPRQHFDRPELLRVHAGGPGRPEPRAGVWHMDFGRQLVPCVYDLIWLAKTGRGTHFNFIVAVATPPQQEAALGRYRVGILNADGSTLFEPEYAWIAADLDLDSPSALTEIRTLLCIEWSSGRPVEASRGRGQSNIWLYADGSQVTHDERLAAKLRRQIY